MLVQKLARLKWGGNVELYKSNSTHLFEIYLANGYQLGSSPNCGAARVFPVVYGVNRVPKKMTQREVLQPAPGQKNISNNDRHKRKMYAGQ